MRSRIFCLQKGSEIGLAKLMLSTININDDSFLKEQNEEYAIDLVNKITSQTLKKETHLEQEDLQLEAKKFLSAVDNLNFRSSIGKLRSALKNPDVVNSKYIDSLSKEQVFNQSLYFLAINFEEQVDIFRKNQLKRKMMYVDVNEEQNQILGTYNFTMQELIYNTNAGGGFRTLTNMLDVLKKKKESFESSQTSKEQKKHIQEAQIIYNNTANRLNRYNEINKKGKKASDGYILQKEGESQIPGNMVTYGDAKEAYVSFLFDKHENDLCRVISNNLSSNKYGTHKSIQLFFDYYISKVDNLKAIIGEDVKTGDAQYGVKGSDSGLPEIQPYYNLAIQIVNQTEIITKQEFENFLATDKYFSAKIERNLRRDIKVVSKAVLEQVAKDFE